MNCVYIPLPTSYGVAWVLMKVSGWDVGFLGPVVLLLAIFQLVLLRLHYGDILYQIYKYIYGYIYKSTVPNGVLPESF